MIGDSPKMPRVPVDFRTKRKEPPPPGAATDMKNYWKQRALRAEALLKELGHELHSARSERSG